MNGFDEQKEAKKFIAELKSGKETMDVYKIKNFDIDYNHQNAKSDREFVRKTLHMESTTKNGNWDLEDKEKV